MRRNKKVRPYLATIYGHQISSALPWARASQTIPGPKTFHRPGNRGRGFLIKGEGDNIPMVAS